MKKTRSSALYPFILMTSMSLILLATIQQITAAKIQKNQAAAAQQLIQSIMPPQYFHLLTAKHLHTLKEKQQVRLINPHLNPNLCPSEYLTLIQSQANGYSSTLTVITSVLSQYSSTTGSHSLETKIRHTIEGVRVVPPQQETPGLGDIIMPKKSPWITQWHHLPLPWKMPLNSQQAHTLIQGIDHMTGATISTKAVISAVSRALQSTDPQFNCVLQQQVQG